MIHIIKQIFLPVILIIGIFITGCGDEDSPEKALTDIQNALKNKNSVELSERVDLEKFFGNVYDDSTLELAKNYDEYQKKYPEDPYFQHDKDFLLKYNSDYREMHLKFLRDVQEAYFKKIPAPEKPEDNPHAYVADEFEKIRWASVATVKNIVVNNDRAVMTVEIKGDESIRGQFIGVMDFAISFDKDDDNKWRVDKIENLDELMPVLVDKAEKVWITFSN